MPDYAIVSLRESSVVICASYLVEITNSSPHFIRLDILERGGPAGAYCSIRALNIKSKIRICSSYFLI